MEKDFLGEDGLLRLLELIGTEFKKYVKSDDLTKEIGDISSALDNIIDIQNSLIGGDA